MKLLSKSLLIAITCFFSAVTPLSAGEVVDLTGTWIGSYVAAFPSGHDHHHDKSLSIDMELVVYRQEGRLFWVENRWRPAGTDEWHSEFGTGVLADKETGALHIVEIDPSPEVGSTGVFEGKISHGKLELVYLGIGQGISFHTVLERMQSER